MTNEEFRQAALAVFGEGYGWQTRISEAIGVDRATISRYIAGQLPIPGPVRAAMRTWLRVGFAEADRA